MDDDELPEYESNGHYDLQWGIVEDLYGWYIPARNVEYSDAEVGGDGEGSTTDLNDSDIQEEGDM